MLIEALNELKISDPERADELRSIYQKQRQQFFNNRIKELTELYELTKIEEKNLWGFLLIAEQPPDDQTPLKSVLLLPNLKDLRDKSELIDDTYESFSILGWLKLYWSQAWRSFADENKSTLAARYVLKNQRSTGKDKAALISTAEKELTSELNVVFPKANKLIDLPVTQALLSETDNNGILTLDISALDYFKQHNIGSASKGTINIFKKTIEDEDYDLEQRRKLWSNPLFFEKMVATCRWLDLTRKYVQSKKENPPALPYQFAIQISQLTTRGNTFNDDQTKILSDSGKAVSAFDRSAYMPLLTAQNLLNMDISILNSLSAKRILTWSVIESHKNHSLNIKTPNVIPIEGGFYTLGEIIGCGFRCDAIKKMKAIISLYSACGYEYEDGNNTITGNLMMYEFIESKKNQSQKLILTLARALCPGFVNEIPGGDSRYNHQKMLIPVLNQEPIFVGRRNDFASQLNFIDKFVIELRQRSVELYKRGGVLVSPNNWIEVARTARMRADLIPKVLDCWTAENYLEEVEDNVFNLGTRYINERDMLREAGEKTHKGSLAGKMRKNTSERKYMTQKTTSNIQS